LHFVIYAILFACLLVVTVSTTTEIYTLSLHDALPISLGAGMRVLPWRRAVPALLVCAARAGRLPHRRRRRGSDRRPAARRGRARSEEHTSELQLRENLVCRLLLEKKKKKSKTIHNIIV